MLKKIAVDQLQVGMYLEEFCCSWMEHPFWRAGFVITDAHDIERIRDSKIAEVWIDCDKGIDISPGKPSISIAEAEDGATLRLNAIAAEGETHQPTDSPADDGYGHAAEVCRESQRLATELFAQARMGRIIDADCARQIVDRIFDTITRNGCALLSLVRLKTASDFTYMHSVAVCALMVALARRMGFDRDQSCAAGLAGLLHDIGKAALPLELLHKPCRLDDHEFSIMQRHPEEGSRILMECGIHGEALDVCMNHHARMDGAGYPHEIGGNDIGIYARMAAVCDVYDAISSGRPYKTAWDPAESIHKMAEWTNGHFDPVVFHAFVKSIGIYPVGSLVRLQSGRLAVVVGQSPKSLLTPSVKVFFSTHANARISPHIVDLAAPGCDETIAAREDPVKWNFPDLIELWSGLQSPLTPSR